MYVYFSLDPPVRLRVAVASASIQAQLVQRENRNQVDSVSVSNQVQFSMCRNALQIEFRTGLFVSAAPYSTKNRFRHRR